MRIIAGDFKGRRLETPDDNQIRPTTDKVKEAMFSIIASEVPGSICVDLFSGTGNLGLEAISRGACKCYFGDNSRQSIGIIKRNIEHCKAESKSTVIPGDYSKVLEYIKEKADVFLIDPPYEAGYYENCFKRIKELNILSEEGIIVAEHRADLELSESIEGFTLIKERRYGNIVLSIYGR